MSFCINAKDYTKLGQITKKAIESKMRKTAFFELFARSPSKSVRKQVFFHVFRFTLYTVIFRHAIKSLKNKVPQKKKKRV